MTTYKVYKNDQLSLFENELTDGWFILYSTKFDQVTKKAYIKKGIEVKNIKEIESDDQEIITFEGEIELDEGEKQKIFYSEDELIREKAR